MQWWYVIARIMILRPVSRLRLLRKQHFLDDCLSSRAKEIEYQRFHFELDQARHKVLAEDSKGDDVIGEYIVPIKGNLDGHHFHCSSYRRLISFQSRCSITPLWHEIRGPSRSRFRSLGSRSVIIEYSFPAFCVRSYDRSSSKELLSLILSREGSLGTHQS